MSKNPSRKYLRQSMFSATVAFCGLATALAAAKLSCKSFSGKADGLDKTWSVENARDTLKDAIGKWTADMKAARAATKTAEKGRGLTGGLRLGR